MLWFVYPMPITLEWTSLLKTSYLLSSLYLCILSLALVAITRYYFIKLLKTLQANYVQRSEAARSIINFGIFLVPALLPYFVVWKRVFDEPKPLIIELPFISTTTSLICIFLSGQQYLTINSPTSIIQHFISIATSLSSVGCLFFKKYALPGLLVLLSAIILNIVYLLKTSTKQILDVSYRQASPKLHILDFLKPLFFPLELILDNLIIVNGFKKKIHILNLKIRLFFSPIINSLIFFALFGFPFNPTHILVILSFSSLFGLFLYFSLRKRWLYHNILYYSIGVTMLYMFWIIKEIDRISRYFTRPNNFSDGLVNVSIALPISCLPLVVVNWYFCSAGFRKISYYTMIMIDSFQHLANNIVILADQYSKNSIFSISKLAIKLSTGMSLVLHSTLIGYMVLFRKRLLRELSFIMFFYLVLYYFAVFIFKDEYSN